MSRKSEHDAGDDEGKRDKERRIGVNTSTSKNTKPSPPHGKRKSNLDGAKRLIFILTLLQRAKKTRKLTVSATLKKMIEENYVEDETSLRAVQRCFQDLLSLPGVKCDEEHPPGYWYEANTDVDILHMTKESALAVCLMEAHLKHFLPSGELKQLSPIFEHASKVLKNQKASKNYDALLERIAIEPRGFHFTAPNLKDSRIFDSVMQALMESKQIAIQYQGLKDKSAKERIIEPVGLVDRSGVLLIVGREYPDGKVQKNWAIHRITEIKIRGEFSYPKDFRVKKHAMEGRTNRHSGRNIKVCLKLLNQAGANLREGECKISEDQVIVEQKDGHIIIEASVPDSAEFRWWILEKGSECEVLAPRELRDEIKKELLRAIEQYEVSSLPDSA